MTKNANYAPGLLGMARVYAESSQAGIRNPAAAVQLAERAARLDARQRAQALLVIAGVQADGGRYAEAISSATAALTIATSQGQEEFAAEIRRRLDRYRAKAKSS